jgi:hypothetical protein
VTALRPGKPDAAAAGPAHVARLPAPLAEQARDTQKEAPGSAPPGPAEDAPQAPK